jgi:hypothetical protein
MRTLVILGAVIVAVAGAPTATADKPFREVTSSFQDFVITDECAFPVLYHQLSGTAIVTIRSPRAGGFDYRLVAPDGKASLTNIETGISITVQGGGQASLEVNPDGSGEYKQTGVSGWNFGDPITGTPGIFQGDGLYRVTFDASGNETSLTLTGHMTDVCAQLAVG